MGEAAALLLVGAIFALVGVAILALFIKSFFESFALTSCNGVVVEVEQRNGRYRPTVEYMPMYGAASRVRSPSWSSVQYGVGQPVEVRYNAARPGEARIAGGAAAQLLGNIIILFAGLAFFAMGAGVFYVGLKRPEQLKKQQAQEAFINAAGNGELSSVKQMLAADPTLINAVRVRRTGGAVVDRPLHAAAKGLHADVVEFLIEHGADPNGTLVTGETPLVMAGSKIALSDDAASARRIEILNLLLDHGARVNAERGRTSPLHANAHNQKAAELLIAHGADVRATDSGGDTPLHSAADCSWDNSGTVDLLLQNGAVLDARNQKNETPLLKAAYNARTAKPLIDHGARTDITNSSGETPLHIAAHYANNPGVEALALLCSCGLKADARDNNGNTPLALAQQQLQQETDSVWLQNRRDIVKFLSPGGECARLAKEAHAMSPEEREFLVTREACENGAPKRCRHLAWLYDSGKGVKADRARAASLYAKLCADGDSWACGNLGYLHHKGEGVAADEKRAAELYQRACDGDESYACYNLATMYESGRGVPEDLTRAIALYRKACAGGDEDGCREAQKH